MFGDPHLVTLDLHKYTFNGYGEFVLIETMDDSFTLQGRMVEATTNSSLNITTTGTVFTALVAEEINSDTVQLQFNSSRGVVVLINREEIDFTTIAEQEFTNVTVRLLANNRHSVVFSSGIALEVAEDNGIVSVLLVSLPRSFTNKTQGLMGNYNGDMSDDLIPRRGNQSLPLNSTLQQIHENFGVTCEKENNNCVVVIVVVCFVQG